MAKPQKENGYTAIANELAEAFSRTPNLGFASVQVIWAILRKTYGWNKKEDSLSVSQIQEATGLSRRCVIYTMQKLESRKIIVVKRERSGVLNETNVVRLNKDYDTWLAEDSAPSTTNKRAHDRERVALKRGGSARLGRVVHDTVKVRPSRAPTKDINTKDITSNYLTSSSARAAEGKTTNFDPKGAEIIKAFCGFNPACGKYYGNTSQRAACDRLIKNYGLEKVLKVVAILPKTNTMQYVPTITTPYALEEKWSALESAMLKKKAEHEDKLTKYKVAFN